MEKAKEMNDKLKKGVPLDELLVDYEKHREKYADRRKDLHKGWIDIAYKHEKNFSPLSPFYLDKSYGDKYNQHNSEEVITDIPYWDSTENDAYYSLPRWKRLQMFLKQKVNICYYKEFIYLNLLIMIVLIYYANKKSKQIIL